MFASRRRIFEEVREARQGSCGVTAAHIEASDYAFRHANELFRGYTTQHLTRFERLQNMCAFHLSIGRVVASVQVFYNCLTAPGNWENVVYIEAADCLTGRLEGKIRRISHMKLTRT